MKITKQQYNKWNEQAKKAAGDGWEFDVEKYVIWGEKAIIKNVPADNGEYDQYKIEYFPEYDTTQKYRRQTGRYIPTLVINRLYPLESGCYRVIEVERRAVGDPQEKKNYNVICTAAKAV